MFTLIKGAVVYAPDFLGKQDVLTACGRIVKIDKCIETYPSMEVEVVDAEGKILIPGLIDQHVHIIGGGGEGGFATRTPEIHAADLLTNGITTVVGILGTDGVARSLEALYAKTKGLEQQGVTAFMYTGNYHLPIKTITGSIQKDLMLIDKVVGVGEVAVADHRSSQPTLEELSRIASDARIGGMLGGKAGVVHLHMGDHPQGLELVVQVVEKTAVPISQFIPSHINRKLSLLQQAADFAQKGGTVDVTAGFEPDEFTPDCVPSYKALKYLMDAGIDENHITMSSDANGSMPIFDANGVLKGMEVGSCKVLMEDLRRAVKEMEVPLEKVLKGVTINPARVLKLDSRKGSIDIGKDADFILLDSELYIEKIYTEGILRVQDGEYMDK